MKKDIDLILSYTKENNGCMEWVRCLNTDGYPRACVQGNVNTKVHRLVFELVHGTLLQGEVVRHKCDNPKCINPDHLEKGTNLDNIRDKNERSGNGQAKLSKDQVRAIRELSDKFKRKELAEMFNVDQRTISSIVLRRHWKHVQ